MITITPPIAMISPTRQYVTYGLFIAAAYFFAAKFGLSLAVGTAQVTTVWPPTGIALAVLFLVGFRYWPAITLGAFLANLTTNEPAPVAMLIAIGNTLEAVLAFLLLRQVIKLRISFVGLGDVFGFILFAAILGPALAATIGVTSLALGELVGWANWSNVWGVWLIGDMMGALVIAPLLLIWWPPREVIKSIKNPIEFLLLLCSVVVIGLYVFSQRIDRDIAISQLTYLFFPFVFWAAVRFRQRGVVIVTFLISAMAIFGTIHGLGPFSVEDETERNLISLQLFMFVESVTGLILGAVVSERRILNQALTARTKQLEGVNRDLQATLRQRRAEEAHLKDVVSQLENTKAAMLNLLEDLEQEKTEVSRARARLEAIVMGVGEGLVVIDNDAKILLVNEVFERLTGWSARDAIGHSIYEVIPSQNEQGEIVQEPERRYQQVLKTGQPFVTSLIAHPHYYVAKDGHRFPVALSVTPMKLNGQIVGAVNVFRDVTHELDVDRAKTEFVSLASHELRTPLTIVRWSIDMLQKYTGPLTDPQRKYVTAIERTGRQMVHLVDALLNVSRIEMGTLMIEPVPTKLDELIATIVKELQPLTLNNKITLKTSIARALPVITLDPQLIRVVITNLLTNAIKYTPPKGRVTIGVTSHGDRVEVAVKDTGYGIPAKEQSKIFTKLFRAENVKSHEARGTGLGLYVTKAVIEQSGGTIWFTSKVNKGSTFTFELPITGVPRRPGSKALSTG